jgi:hypothetical protein
MFTYDTLPTNDGASPLRGLSVSLNRPTAVLTDRGVAVNAVYKLLESLRALGPDDRRDILELLDLELTEQLA